MKKYLPAAVVDVLLVLIFAALGRRSHEEASTIGGLLTTAWPFLTVSRRAGSSRSACTGTSSIRGWRYRRRDRLAVDSGGRMLLRVVSDQGTAFSFIVVAASFLGLFLIGWRALYQRSVSVVLSRDPVA
ncbi:DUF3054 family protein [Rhodococcus hoagii]|nr:DUF3054 family protein [Prescottella equi]